jgi:Tol biopolymer transport system component
VAFESEATNLVADDTNDYRDIFVYDRQTDSIERVSVAGSGTQGNGESYRPSISADGRYVAFDSLATNLVAGDTNGVRDIFAAPVP